jgi:hypothetical protein
MLAPHISQVPARLPAVCTSVCVCTIRLFSCTMSHLHTTPLPSGARLKRTRDGEWIFPQIPATVRADAQQLVVTRLLDCVHDPVAHFGRLQRIRPRRWSNDNPLARWPDISGTPVANLLRCVARGLFVYNYDMRDKIIAFRHGF